MGKSLILPHFWVCGWLFLGSVSWSLAKNPSKKALLITIAHYADKNWAALNADRDRLVLTETLQRQEFGSILTCTNAQATRKGITQSLQQLYNQAQPGDKLVIHYSGHGCQLKDDTGDEADGKDECLVPYDAPKRFDASYSGTLHLRDDELGNWLDRLREKVGSSGQVVLFLDSCHSGTASRGESQVRGESGMISDFLSTENGSGLFESRSGRGLGKLVFISGAKSTQPNYETKDDEGKKIGSLSYAISKAFEQLEKGTVYRVFFEVISTIMAQKAPGQTPQLEGDSEELVLGGMGVIRPTFYSVTGFVDQVRTQVTVAAGTLSGLFKGAKVRLRSVDNPRGDDDLEGEVIESSTFQSKVRLKQPLPTSSMDFYKVYEYSKALDNWQLFLKTELSENRQHALYQRLEHNKALVWVSDSAEVLVKEQRDNLFIIHQQDAEVWQKLPLNDQWVYKTEEALQNYIQAKLLRELTLQSSNSFQAKLELVPVRLEKDEKGNYKVVEKRTASGGYPIFSTQDQGWLSITNTGKTAFYFNLIDIEPQGKTSVLLPGKGWGKEGLYLKPQQTLHYPIETISPPYGIEMYKLLMASQPFDLRTAVLNRGNIPEQESDHPYQRLFRSNFRGSKPDEMSLDQLGTASFVFEIIPARKK
ncbi:caspase family protein [Siphonobacter sp. SORGH_AS_0500]|uniref:caspase family protein n=1 Tax=Siphonobacter sp. SORGH_AS_0500 TaxID=1864824 RepID=UPI0028642789|nr:caspase family protein [Siphonobacter sp. SORGH_AS_0500]MDR6197845.1 hypothetical protein [Siphonobacter sp. SORGH_AS_0500]